MQPPDKQQDSLPATVILVGASVRAAAQSARRGGFSVIGVDLFGDSDALAACDHHVLLSEGRQNKSIEELFANDPNLSNLPVFRVGGLDDSHLNKQTTIICPSIAVTQSLKDPGLLDQLAKQSGLRVPETLLEYDTSLADRPRSGCWIKKNLASSGGTGVTWYKQLRTQAVDRRTAAGVTPNAADFHLQRWIAGRNYGATFFADLGRVSLLGIFRSLFVHRGDRPFLYAGSVGPIDYLTTPMATRAKPSLPESILHFGELVAEQFQLRGLFNVDFIVDRNGMGWILEVNPRWTAASELVERGLIEAGAIGKTDSLMRWHIRANIQRTTQALNSDQEELLACRSSSHAPVWIKQILYASRPGKLDLKSLDTVSNRSAIEFADLPPAPRHHRRGEPLLSMIGRLPSVENKTGSTNQSNSIRPSQWRRAIQETLAKIK
jgi:uncharacterized protein